VLTLGFSHGLQHGLALLGIDHDPILSK